MEKIEIKLNAVEVTQGIGKILKSKTEDYISCYVEIPKHWVKGKIVLVLVEPSEYEKLR